jgi:membrane fusion protein, heavy metal efflux system
MKLKQGSSFNGKKMKQHLPSLIIAILLLTSCGKQQDESGLEQDANMPAPSLSVLTISSAELKKLGASFETVRFEQMSTIITIPASIILDQDRTGTAASLVDGRIRAVRADIGDYVLKGSPLVTIESMQIGQLISELLRTNAEQETAKNEYLRLKGLREKEISSDKLFQRAKSNYRAMSAQFNGSKKQLIACGATEKEIQALLETPSDFEPVLTVRAPITGTIISRNAAKGARVTIDNELFVIVNTSSVHVQGNAFPEHLSLLREKLNVEFTTNAYPGERFPGILTVVNAALDVETQSLKVRATMPNGKGKLKPHLAGELHIPTGPLKEGLSVPQEALIYDGEDTYVFKDGGNGTLVYMQVQAGNSFGDMVEITAGLNEGDRVACTAVFMLKSKFKLLQMQDEE